MGHRNWLACGLAMGIVASAGSACAQGKLPFSPKASAKANAAQSAIDKEQDRRQRLNQAKRNFTKAELAAMAAASEEIASARLAHRTAVKDYQATRDSVAESVDASLGVKKVRDEVAAAQKAYRDAADPVVDALKASTEYKAAEKTSETAKAKIKDLQEETSLSDEERKSRLLELVGESMTASNLERSTLQKHPQVQAARERMEAAQQKLNDLQKKAAEKVEKDSTVTAAQEAVKGAYASIDAAEAKLAAVETKAAMGEQMLKAGVIPRGGKPGKKN